MSLSRRSAGFSLIEVVVGTAILGILTIIVGTVITVMSQSQNAAMVEAHLQVTMREIIDTLNSSNAWSRTIQYGSSAGAGADAMMDCLDNSNGVPCTTSGAAAGPPITNLPFTLINVEGNPVVDTLTPDSGFDVSGRRCAGFIAPPALGNDFCPFRYEITWSALCAAGDCTNPAVEVNARLTYNPANPRLNLNWNRFNINKFIIAPDVCTNGFQVFLFPGTYDFDVPAYSRNLVVEAWGGGGGANGIYGAPGGVGGESSWDGTVKAGGGQGGNGNTYYLWTVGASIGNVQGGVASGGLLNINGGATDWVYFFRGGAAPSSGLQTIIQRTPCNTQLTGGSGGPGSMNNKLMGGDGFPGRHIGGGGAGPFAALGFWFIGAGWGFTTQAGGGGAYSARWYPAGTWAAGTKIQVVVGAGGTGTDGASSTLWTGAPFKGGDGADGAVLVLWE